MVLSFRMKYFDPYRVLIQKIQVNSSVFGKRGNFTHFGDTNLVFNISIFKKTTKSISQIKTENQLSKKFTLAKPSQESSWTHILIQTLQGLENEKFRGNC